MSIYRRASLSLPVSRLGRIWYNWVVKWGVVRYMTNNQSPASDSSKQKRRHKNRRHAFFLLLKLALLFGGMGIFMAGGILTGYVAALVRDEPVRSYDEIYNKIFSFDLTGFVYYNDNTLLAQMRTPDQDRRLVKRSDVSPYLINAIIATEDRNFFFHYGVSLTSTLRGAYQDFTNQPVVTGGSTLTQQLVKLTILSPEVSHKRKAKEIFTALRIDRMFSKDQILEAYMNEIYFGKSANGSNIYGVQAAAKGIFDKDVKDINLGEASYLAGMIQNPGNYNPFSKAGYERGKERQKMVLDRMMENRFISQAQYDEALKSDLVMALAKPAERTNVNHLMMEIEERAAKALVDSQLAEEGRDKSTVGKNEYYQLIEDQRREILKNGYKIYTTIDKDVQQIMTGVASDPQNFGKNRSYTVRRSNGKTEKIENALEEVGSMLIQNKTGAILGMIGGRDFNVQQTNHATAPRQPGSSMKPLAAYAPAFELGILQPGSPIDDSPLLLADGTQGSHLPLNWDNKFHGIMSAREALRQSWNVPAIKTYLKVGIPTALEYVKKMGITTLVESDNYAATGAIGGLSYGLTAEELTNAYATFANHGSFIDAYMIDRIEDSTGKVIYKHEIQPVTVFSEQTAYLMTDMLRTVVNAGTGTQIRKYVPRSIDVAGKTGTTNNSNDLVFVGYTPELSMGVWVGFDEPYPMPDSEKYRPMIVWGKVMQQVIEQKPELSPPTATFPKPEGITSMTVDSKSGLLPSELSKETKHLITDLFNRQFIPTKMDDTHQRARVVVAGDNRYLAKASTPNDFVTEGIFFRSPEPLMLTAEQIKTMNSKAGTRPADWDQRLPETEDPRTDQPGAPAAPTDVTISRSGNNIVLSWKSGGEPDLLGYRIYRASADNGFVQLATVKDPLVLSYTDSTAAPAESGYYVTAVDVAGQESSPSPVASSAGTTGWQPPEPLPNNPDAEVLPPEATDGGEAGEQSSPAPQPDSTVPSAVKNLKLSKVDGGIKLQWKDNPSNEQVIGYNVYYTPDPVNGFALLETVAENSYTHQVLDPNGWYYVTAVNSYGESPQGEQANGATAE